MCELSRLPVDDADEGADAFASDDFGEGPPVSDGSAEATPWPVETATPKPTAKVRPLRRDAFFVTMSGLLCLWAAH
jgi:hypothetical protein